MRRRRKLRRKLFFVAAMLVMCLLAGMYIVKLAGDRAEQARQAEAEAEAAQAEAEAEAEAAEKEAAAKSSEHVYANCGNSEDAKYTMASYESAVEAGASCINLPFVVSQDGTMYVADDDYALELTGTAGYFSGMTDGQIENLQTSAGTKVLKLSEVFDKYNKDINYIIELRYTGERNIIALEEIIDKYELGDKVTVSCGYFNGIRSLENDIPDITKIFLCSDQGEFNEALTMSEIDIISVNKDMMSEENCKSAHDNDKKFGAWTLNTEEEIKAAIEMGADSYFTDETALAIGLEKENRQ